MPDIKENNINFFYQNNKKYILKKINKYFSNDQWINGKIIKKLEKKFIENLNTKGHVISCNSGTDALKLAIELDKDKKRDIYITSPFSYISSSSVIKSLNLNIIYIDLEDENYLLSLKKLEIFLRKASIKIKKRIKGIIFVELFGNTTDLTKLRRLANYYGLSLIGDCAQSFGTKFLNKPTCNYYDFAAYSFYPTKILSAYGDAGILYMKKKSNLKKAQLLKNNGHDLVNKDICKYIGINSRMDSIQAYILNENLKKFRQVLKAKAYLTKHYDELLNKKINKPLINYKTHSNNYIYSIYIKKNKRKKFIEYMKKNKVECKIFYKRLLPENKTLKPIIKTKLKSAERNKLTLVCLPNSQELNRKHIYRVSKLVNNFFEKDFI